MQNSTWCVVDKGDLTFEGLHLTQRQNVPQTETGPNSWRESAFISVTGNLAVDHCVFESQNQSAGIAFDGQKCELRDTVFHALEGACVKWMSADDSTLVAERCTFRGRYGLMTFRPLFEGATRATFDRCTFDTEKALLVARPKSPQTRSARTRTAQLHIRANQNLFHSSELVSVFRTPAMNTQTAIRFLRTVLDWKGSSNVFASTQAFASLSRGHSDSVKTLLPEAIGLGSAQERTRLRDRILRTDRDIRSVAKAEASGHRMEIANASAELR